MTILPVADTLPPVVILPPVTLPVAVTKPPVSRLPAVVLPVIDSEVSVPNAVIPVYAPDNLAEDKVPDVMLVAGRFWMLAVPVTVILVA